MENEKVLELLVSEQEKQINELEELLAKAHEQRAQALNAQRSAESEAFRYKIAYQILLQELGLKKNV